MLFRPLVALINDGLQKYYGNIIVCCGNTVQMFNLND